MANEPTGLLVEAELFRRLVESVRDYAIFMLDPTGHVATWNKGAEWIKGYSAEEIVGKHFSIFYPSHDVAMGKCERGLEEAASQGRYEDEGWRVRKDGTQFWANVVITAVTNPSGGLLGFAKVTRDLTERRSAEEERAARYAAERANRAKDEFLAMLGHELRNPLAPIVTALQLMKLRGDYRTTKEQDVIERHVKHMVRLVEDLLDVSRVMRGHIDMRSDRVDLRDVIGDAIEMASPVLEIRRHHFHTTWPPHPVRVQGDRARLTQVFANLVVNAAKYTDQGGHIHLTVSSHDHDVVIDVEDDGQGIDPDLLPHVFDLFVQGYQGMERASGGLGLGLALVRSFVAAHGGRVEARSAGKGKGSTFTVVLPLAESEAQRDSRTPDLSADRSHTRRVLIVDDNEDAAEVLSDLLVGFGHDVERAHDGPAALAIASRFLPDVAILDLGLPVMDGYELGKRLIDDLGEKAPRLVALTGYGQERDRQRSLAAGFDEHLVKPVDTARLMMAIESDAPRLAGQDTARQTE